jgi:lipid A 3-O-deacylase
VQWEDGELSRVGKTSAAFFSYRKRKTGRLELSGAVFGAENAATNAGNHEVKPWVRRVSFGIVAHDIGFISDQRENGVDPNWEVQFNRPDWTWWRWLGSPYPSIGVTPNFNGETTAFYFRIFNYEFSLSNKFLDDLTNDFTKNLWISGGLTRAIHTGPLHKNEAKCIAKSDCGFGSRVLPRISLEIDYTFWKNHALSLFFDHMSHQGVGCSCIQNEGIDHTGIRYHFTFNKPPSPDISLKEQAP